MRGMRSLRLAAAAALGLSVVGAVPAASAATAPEPGGAYVALGSSYASGPVIPETLDAGCGRSSSNYAHLVAARLGLQLTDASCQGATTDGVISGQFAALTPNTKYVTVTVGGNDVNYTVSTVLCSEAGKNGESCLGTTVDPAAISTLMGSVKEKLVMMLDGIEQRSPNAKVFLVAYPSVLPASGKPCPPSVPMTVDSAAFIAKTGRQLQRRFNAAAKQAGVTFVDTYTPSKGHTACAKPAQRWIEGAVPASPAFIYHPNARGMAAEARLVAKAMRAKRARA
jgi:GDSL-like Lipase/Acylhydrolase family